MRPRTMATIATMVAGAAALVFGPLACGSESGGNEDVFDGVLSQDARGIGMDTDADTASVVTPDVAADSASDDTSVNGVDASPAEDTLGDADAARDVLDASDTAEDADVARDVLDASDTAADAGDGDLGTDTPGDTGGPDTTPDAATYRTSLDVCWSDLGCPRAFVISHGGDWSVTFSPDDLPYASEGAFHRAYDNGADGVKTDFRVASDGVAMVAHSSPIELWESLDCAGKKIEEHPSAEIAACHLLPSTTETFQRVGDVLDWARGKLTIMLTVKDGDFGAAIASILAHDAAAYTFIEVRLGDLQTTVAALPPEQRDAVYYNAELGSEADLPALLALGNARVLMVELDSYDAGSIAGTIANVIHPAGMRAFVQAQFELSEVQQHALFDLGFDVDMSYSLVNGVAARKAVNTARGVSPP